MELAKIIIFSKTTTKQYKKPDSNDIYLDKFPHRWPPIKGLEHSKLMLVQIREKIQ